jgi:putative methyltransferase (TIGR04325 family)
MFDISWFRGVYANFHEAKATAPKRARIGYNHEAVARQYRAQLDLRLENYDYPVLYHLTRLVNAASTILDFGGNVGVHYLRYKKYLDLEKVRWIVCDLPEITKIGQQVCAGEASNIVFVNDIDQLKEPKIDIFLACGSLQYVESHDLLLARLVDNRIRPRHILIDQLPLYSGRRFVTLQNGGFAYCAHHVFNRVEYIATFTDSGYQLVDCWFCANQSCNIPFHPDRSFPRYSGLYFRDARSDRNGPLSRDQLPRDFKRRSS